MVRSGTSLVEVAVALVLAGVGISAVAEAGNAALRLSRQARTMHALVAHAGAVADSLASTPDPHADSLRLDPILLAWSVEAGDADGVARILLRATDGGRDTIRFLFLASPHLPRID